MPADSLIATDKLASGSFSKWLAETKISLQGKEYTDVPCKECTSCCHSSYFIHIKPIDSVTLKHVPKQLVFPAPGLPQGNFLLGYDENGRCPMFKQEKCSIYEYRPQTCRQYDCRIFPATGYKLTEADKKLITQQAERWEFDLTNPQDRNEFDAVQAAAKFLGKHASRFPPNFLPGNTTQRAILAIDIYSIFLNQRSPLDEAAVVTLIKNIVEFNY